MRELRGLTALTDLDLRGCSHGADEGLPTANVPHSAHHDRRRLRRTLTTGPAHFVPQVHFTERRQSLLQFVTSVCAIVGGVFTVSGLVDALVFQVLSPPTQTKLPALRIPCRQKRRPRPALPPFGTTLQVVTAHCCWSEQGQKVIKKKMELGKFG